MLVEFTLLAINGTFARAAERVPGRLPSRSIIQIGQRIHPHPALSIDRHPLDASPAESEQRERLQQRDVHFVADDDAKRRSTEEAVVFDVPSSAPEQRVTSRGESAEIRHRRAGHDRATGRSRQPKDVDHPLERDVLECSARGRHDAQGDVLIPGTDQPACGKRGWKYSAVYEAEIASAGCRDCCRRAQAVNEGQYFGRRTGQLRQRLVEFSQRVDVSGLRDYGARRTAAQILLRATRRNVQEGDSRFHQRSVAQTEAYRRAIQSLDALRIPLRDVGRVGVGNGVRTRDFRSHSPALYR